MWCYCVFHISTSVMLLCFRLPSAWCYCVSDRYWCGVVFFPDVRQRGVTVFQTSIGVVWCIFQASGRVVSLCVSDLYWYAYFSDVRQRRVTVCFRPLLVWCGVFFRRPAAWCPCVFQTSIGVVWSILRPQAAWCHCVFQTSIGVVYFSDVRQRGVGQVDGVQ